MWEEGRKEANSTECIMEEERRKNHVLGDPTCQFYIMGNERERERMKKRAKGVE